MANESWLNKVFHEHLLYSNMDPRRRQEMRDANMIREDHTAIGNLPKTSIHTAFGRNAFSNRVSE